MPINTPTYKEIVNRVRADIANELPDVDPTIAGSFVNALAVSNAGRHYDNVVLISQLIKELFPQTASGEYLERWAQYEGLSRISATPSSGFITVTGVAATSIPALTEWRTSDNLLFASLSAATVAATSISVSSITCSGGTTATVTTASNHTFATGMEITIAGAVPTGYNGIWTITVLSEDTFSFEVPSTLADDSGTTTAGYTGASIEVEAVEPGVDGNLESGAQLQVTAAIIGLDADAFVQYLGLTGGGDEETDDALRERVLYSRANPVAHFNTSDIILTAKTVPGVTRVFVNPITPYVGAVTVAFMRDDDVNPIPDAGEVQDVRDVLLEILPANTDPNDLVVQAPTPVSINFTFSSITPDTPTMRTAITNSLTVFFDEETEYETNIDEDKYRSIIINSYDSETGDSLQSFILATPTTDITISTDEIGILGTITYP